MRSPAVPRSRTLGRAPQLLPGSASLRHLEGGGQVASAPGVILVADIVPSRRTLDLTSLEMPAWPLVNGLYGRPGTAEPSESFGSFCH